MLFGIGWATVIQSPLHEAQNSTASGDDMRALNSIMTQIVKTISECTIDENSLYRTIAEKLPKEVTTKTPTKAGAHLRKKAAEIRGATAAASATFDDGTIDREAFVASFFGHATKAESNRQGISRFVSPFARGSSVAADDVTSALEMMRACVAFHGYCVKALEATQELIVSSSICRDLSKTKKREIGENLIAFRDSTHTRMLQLASQKQVMGDLVRAVISRSNTVSPVGSTGAPTDGPIASSEPASDEPVRAEAPEADEEFENVVDPGDLLEHLLTEWHLVPREAPLPPLEEFEVDSDPEDGDYLSVRMKPTTTSEPVTF